jgi:nicotinamide phosphoribosyltransferase
VFKITPNKSSKAGRLRLVRNYGGDLYTFGEKDVPPFDILHNNELKTVFENGELVKEYTFDEVRQNAGCA